MKRTEGERHAPQGRARTMSDEQEAIYRAGTNPIWVRDLIAELDAERAAHEATRIGSYSAETMGHMVEECDRLKARLALAEAVESALGAFLNRAEFFRGRSEWRETLAKADNALAAWRAAK